MHRDLTRVSFPRIGMLISCLESLLVDYVFFFVVIGQREHRYFFLFVTLN